MPKKAKMKQHNPLLSQQQDFLNSLKKKERDGFFSSSSLSAERRAEIWMLQADLGESLVNKYSWATPDERSLEILKHFSPIVEIGCGRNAYWCQLMAKAGIDVVGYDVNPEKGGTIGDDSKKKNQKTGFPVKHGGPEVLRQKAVRGRTLFLCYPDEEDYGGTPLGEACLEHYTGDYIILVGEWFGDSLSLDQAPWGRSASPKFQERLASEYHCLLKASLTNWLHVRDTISVWKRTETCSIVFAGEDSDDSDEEVEYRHVPVEERLPVDIAAPCLEHLLKVNDSMPTDTVAEEPSSRKKKKNKTRKHKHTEVNHETLPIVKAIEEGNFFDSAKTEKKKKKRKSHGKANDKSFGDAGSVDRVERPW